MEHQLARLDVEWIGVSKRRLYTLIFLLVLTLLGGAGLSFYLSGQTAAPARDETKTASGARFDTLEGEVRVTRAATRRTLVADAATQLYPGDVVQTQPGARAGITLVDGSTLVVRPNSVITIAENDRAEGGGTTRVRVAVESGQVKVSTGVQTPQTSNVVETPLTSNKLSAQTAASFDVLEDKTEEVRVMSGSVESSASGGSGDRLTIGAGEYLARHGSGNVKRREQLLDAPVPYTPHDRERIETQGEETASVALQWAHPLAAASVSYRVEIAASPFFVKPSILFERGRLIAPRLLVTKLAHGNYFWRVQAVSATGQASEWCRPQKFTLVGKAEE
ncbi:MAG TPA: FecR domain-containing protein [Pyrinomonadaceae bacterium]|nr:FecR domain-containing protein [Pyrinomonadaceae bacterium]